MRTTDPGIAPRLLAGFASLMILVAGNVAMAGDRVFPYRCYQKKLANALTVIVIPMASHGLVTYFSIVRTGSRDEVEPGKSGFAHFFEHMMFRGTKQCPQPVYQRIVGGMGAHINAFTTDDFTAFHLSFAKEDLEQVAKIESDRFQHLCYEKAAFQTEAGAVYGEYRKNITQPFALLEEKLSDLAYVAHPYKHTTIGFEADIKRMPEAYEYSLSFFRRFYRPENVVLLIAGDVEVGPAFAVIQKYYSPWKTGYVAPQIPQEPPQTAPRSAEVAYPGATLPLLTIAYHGDRFDPANRDYVAALLLGDLAFGSTSAIHKRLVIHQQKVEFIEADIPMNRDPSLFSVTAMVKSAADVSGVRDAIDRTLEEFKTKAVDEKRLQAIKRQKKYAFLMELDSPEKVTQSLARIVALTGGVEAVDQLYAAYQQVTAADIRQAARKYFDSQRRTVVVLKGVGSRRE
jgi:zinc protease